jgi:hypothetical protein
MATGVVLVITPPTLADPHHPYELPQDLASVLAAHGLMWRGAMSRSGGGPWRLNVRISGPDRLTTGPQVTEKIAALGYEVALQVQR